jgi:hypothetical protein
MSIKETKPRKEKEARYVTDNDKRQHFKEVVDKSTMIMDRQLKKIGKCAKSRTMIYSVSQVENWNLYALAQIEKTRQRLLRTVEPETKFTVGD